MGQNRSREQDVEGRGEQEEGRWLSQSWTSLATNMENLQKLILVLLLFLVLLLQLNYGGSAKEDQMS